MARLRVRHARETRLRRTGADRRRRTRTPREASAGLHTSGRSPRWRRWLRVGFLPMAVLVTLLSFAEFGIRLLERTQASQADNTALSLAADLRTQLESHINRIVYLSSGLASYFEINAQTLDDREVTQMLASLHRNTVHVRNMGVAVGYELRYVVPLDGNRAVLGIDYRQFPEQYAQVLGVISTGKASLTPRIPLIQGGYGVIYRSPILVNGEYWGLLSTVIDIDGLLSDTLSEYPNSGLQFSVLDRGENPKTLWGSADIAGRPGVRSLSTEMGWHVFVEPELSENQILLQRLFRWLSWGLSVVAAAGLFAIQVQRFRLLRLSRRDSLTEVANRRAFDERLDRAVDRLERDPDSRFAIAIVDLNGFKQINDVHGHAMGDAVLREVAHRMASRLRASDLVSRWGGDEFGVFLDASNDADLQLLEQRISSVFLQPVGFRQAQIRIGGSIGIVSAPRDGCNAHDLLTAADDLMYRAKRRPRARQPLRTVRRETPSAP